jgi:hypothetical protein
MEIQENKTLSIYNASDLEPNFKNLIFDIEICKSLNNVLILSTMECDLPGGNKSYDFKNLNNICEKYNINVNIIFGNSNQEYYNNIKNYSRIVLHFWPTFLLNYTYNKFDKYNGIKIEDFKKNLNFDKLFVCYNHKPHLHRCKLMDKLYENNLFDCGIISWNKLNEINFNFTHWKENILNIDDYNQDFFHRTSHIIKNSSFIFLVSETVSDNAFITEKTFKPILIEQPFICLSGKLHHTILKDLGFELYDEIFDYSFDYFEDVNDRIDSIIDNLQKIKNENYFKLYKKIENKIKHNKETAISIVRDGKLIPKIIKENNISFIS